MINNFIKILNEINSESDDSSEEENRQEKLKVYQKLRKSKHFLTHLYVSIVISIQYIFDQGVKTAELTSVFFQECKTKDLKKNWQLDLLKTCILLYSRNRL